MIHCEPKYKIYFGDASDHIYPRQYIQGRDTTLLAQPQIRSMAAKFQLVDLIFLSQIHGKDGVVITNETLKTMQPFSVEGDFLISRERHLGLAILTADCLPVVCYDKQRHVAGIAHAGWRGAVAGVVPAMIEMMHEQFHTDKKDITVFLGPSAKPCCYRVDDSFTRNLNRCYFAHNALLRCKEEVYFDLPGFVKQQLVSFGIDNEQVKADYNDCTICNDRFCSYRRGTNKGNVHTVGRQMTVVVLK